MSEFVSKLEEIMPAIELNFEPTPAFGKYKRFLEHAVAHPAKMNTNLLEFLILNFTKEGDVILDPMAGSGSTGVVAALHGRNAIQVDIEKKFYDWMEQAREKVEQFPTLIKKGWIRNICGDARRLSELLSQADVVITSPPYLKSADTGAGVNKQREGDVKIGCATVGRTVEHPEAIDNTRDYGNIDAIITSPPYVNVDNVKKDSEAFWRRAKEEGKRWGLKPPSGTEGKQQTSEGNIANLPFVDAVITSPPYEHQLHDSHEERVNWKGAEIDKSKNLPVGYSPNPDNIGNMRKETYLEAMLRVYAEMFKVLKPNGLAIVVVKPFIRNKKVVDLPYHTFLLMSHAGFKLEKLYKLRLKNQSFWRILYYKKYPDMPRIAHEYVLVARKAI